MELDGWEAEEDLGGVGGGETMIRIHCMKKKYFQVLKMCFSYIFVSHSSIINVVKAR